MKMAKSKKEYGVVNMPKTADEYPSTLSLTHKHAKGLAHHKLGKTHKMVVTAKKTGHHIGMDGKHSANYDITSIMDHQEPDADNKGGASDNDADNQV
jgi:hypothetical protein